MTVPIWVLLAFAGWTVLTLLGSVGVYRWSRILTGRAELREFPADRPHGADWYRRAMRAHANCVENLPVYAALVVLIMATGISDRTLDYLAIAILVARILQTLVHIGFSETNAAVGTRFAFFFVQLIGFVLMGAIIAVNA